MLVYLGMYLVSGLLYTFMVSTLGFLWYYRRYGDKYYIVLCDYCNETDEEDKKTTLASKVIVVCMNLMFWPVRITRNVLDVFDELETRLQFEL